MPTSTIVSNRITAIESIIGTDEGNRGMKALIVPGDLQKSAETIINLPQKSTILILSGFPCCVHESPPTETDGPPGAISIAKTVLALGMGHTAILVTDECNELVFRAAADCDSLSDLQFEIFPAEQKMTDSDTDRMERLVNHQCDLIVSCERAGPARDGMCYTMRGINMNEHGLIAPIHKIVDIAREIRQGVKYIAIGDGGNELGMGKVIDKIRESDKIQDGDKIGAVTKADFLIAASVSNWGGYALSAACAIMKRSWSSNIKGDGSDTDQDWVEKCVPTNEDEIALLDRCVEVGCRDGVSGKVEATVDGMSLETSLEFLAKIRNVAQTIDPLNDKLI